MGLLIVVLVSVVVVLCFVFVCFACLFCLVLQNFVQKSGRVPASEKMTIDLWKDDNHSYHATVLHTIYSIYDLGRTFF